MKEDKPGRVPTKGPPSNARIVADQESAKRRALRALEMTSDEEDATITAAALADPDNPPRDDAFFAGAKKLGRPKSGNPKQAISIRLDADVIEHFRSGGDGWQSRINEALRKAAKLPKAG